VNARAVNARVVNARAANARAVSTRARDNPFRAARIEGLRYRAPGFRWPDLTARLASQGGRGAIRGAQGSGKTTLLHELGDRLAAAGWEVRRLRPDLDDRRLVGEQVHALTRGAGKRTALLLDGADRLGLLRWSLFLRAAQAAGVLVVTTHREGRLPTLHRCRTTPRLLAELVAELRPAGLPEVSLEALFRRQRGNLRAALRSLYDAQAAR